MKTLILIRHGKSDWSAGVSDKERPLNQRGLNDAPLMAEVLQHQNQIPELLYVSSAKRTTQTAEILAQTLSIPQEHLITSPELYLCDAFAIEEIINFAPADKDNIAIIGHNPILSEMANQYSKKKYVNMPTLGIFISTFDTDDWALISRENAIDEMMLHPKLFK
ncbi:MAG: histidine phosphatase family protein [Bacteroidales bacterium]|jgi:phosphohistidine phosphatase|nr:histidine phosphatase family protein [Bacteroidales bacterium]